MISVAALRASERSLSGGHRGSSVVCFIVSVPKLALTSKRSAFPDKWAMSSSLREKSSMCSRPEHCFKKHGAWSCSGLPMQSGYPYSRCGLDRIKGNCITVLWCGCSMICLVFRPEGCSCAGPYGHTLLDLTPEHSEALAAEVRRGFGYLRPGWVRFNLHWLSTEEEADYVLRAVTLIARWGNRLLPSYTLDTKTGLWQHRDYHEAPSASLDNFILAKTPEASSANCPSPAELLHIAEQTLSNGAAHHHHLQAAEAHQKTPWPRKAEALCWFLRPHERNKTSGSQ